jgi:NADPH2 dehydrogenase
MAVKAGFRHVQLHAAHGYLFNLLIDRRLSAHADLATKSIEAWAKELASIDVETSLRFSMWSGHPFLDLDTGDKFADEIAAMPVNYIDASVGFYNIDKRLIYPSTPTLLSARVTATLAIANRHPSANLIMSGMSNRAWDDLLPNNIHIGICRDLIANPNFLQERANGCKTCMKCHYFSRGAENLTCGLWRTCRVVAREAEPPRLL